MASPTILIIEDDAQVRDIVARYLERDEFRTLVAANGRDGLELAQHARPALVLLDVNLPDLDGWSILRRLRGEGAPQPAVIMLTARSDEPDRLLGLDLGADDYIVKPFSPREVVARVKAVLRRFTPHATEALCFPGLRIDCAGRAVWREERPVTLTPKEFDLLVVLASQPNRVLTRMTVYDLVWGEDGQGDDHTLDVHVNRLRHKLVGDDGYTYLKTLKGVGLKFEVSHESS
ncbi:MAG TPA: response regulator transcription factor [Armatimonadota bacterium]|jgi:two-component system response regulator ResD